MLLPWSHESTELRRRPWITLALIAVCVVVLVGSQSDPAVQQFERTLGKAHDFWQSHPYLEPGQLLAAHFGDDGADARKEFRADLTAGRVPIPVSAVEAEQRDLDVLTAHAEAALERHVWYRFGLVPTAIRWQGVLGHMFLHAGWAHLLGNLLFLFLTGPFIEDRWGRSVFLMFYLGAGATAGMVFAFQSPDMTGPLVGASGAIAGAMGAFLVLFATVRIKFAYWLGFFWGTFAAPAWLLLPLWFAGELATARLMDVAGASDGVAYWAHVGGFGFGVLVAGLMRLSGVDAWMQARTEKRAAAKAEVSQPPGDTPPNSLAPKAPAVASLGRLWTAVAKVDRSGALREWGKLMKAGEAVSGGDSDVTLRLAGWLAATGQQAAAGSMLEELLPRCDAPTAARIAGVARRMDPKLAARAAKQAGAGPAPKSGPAQIGKVKLVQRAVVQATAPPTSADSRASIPSTAPPAPIEEEDLDLFETDAVDLSKDDEAWAEVDLDVDLAAPGSHAGDSGEEAELFDSEAFDFSEE
ncbi:MAG: rhomboid family intramembrane serine protease [Deltaproteobacteria bacterium]|nr:rhomboid family intramembrane serine protease [Deltaproteobacteria bacterium]